jgi:hypothetical protein
MKKVLRKIGFTAVAFLASVGAASAAVPAGVSTSLGDAATDAATVGGLALVAIVSAVAFKYMRRAL